MHTSRRKNAFSALSFVLISLLYVAAVFLTFKPRSSGLEYGLLVALAFTLLAGFAVFAVGYASVVAFGGVLSLKLVEFTSRLNGSKHAIEVEQGTGKARHGSMNDFSLIYVPAMVFLIALALFLNIHYLNSTFSVSFHSFPSPTLQELLGALDILIKPTSIGSLRYSIDIIPTMVGVVAVAGVVPSMVYPYLRKFKVTSFNGAPFHKDILFGLAGSLFGVTILLSMGDVIYGVLTGVQPHYYSYVLPALVGFSLHLFLGIYLGKGRAEKLVERNLGAENRRRVFRGRIVVQQNK